MTLNPNDWLGPAVIAAFVSGVITVVGMLVNRATNISINEKKIAADQDLAERRFNFDKELARERFSYDRQQAIFKRRFELAEQVLADAYRFRSMMKFVRNGAAFGGEGETREADGHESDNVKRNRNTYFVPIERLKAENEFISAMFARRTACRAHFGSDAEKAFDLFHQGLHRVRVASSLLVEWTSDYEKADKETMQKLRHDIWEPMAEHAKTNDIGQMIDEGVALVESFCDPILSWVDKP